MTWHLLAVFIIGLCLGGMSFFLRKVSRNRLPSWIIPVSAGVGMLGYLAYYDYGWFEFKKGQLPPQAVIIEQSNEKNFFKPWRYVVPTVSSFAILDGQVRSTLQDGELLIEYVRYTFINDYNERLETQPYVLNCTTGEQLPIPKQNDTNINKVERIDENSLLFQQLCR
ncbi:MAG TPA: hypothetical protein VFD11_07035 [Thiopseudomonas sp.]|nr:hypothetical protein [Thiopseudomonas sp.]